ncbi:hypothetical protein CH63R_10215 [Colletotrichum higginsianum IMI 349063]|uniref:Uncharacterized protein n=1 Tax=Colletotrichum higginsianum (strain IMI 349063) TaxID=759273 RepID=A0A1B7Y267_COLHI|nr:uncharacterized protein CH63R_10215 [Colletotrichum higginsianum IMI 349063]OBR06095.1 hypothetical protein CH63R_10215 [Colletotrichum higginsianum IMI 349063]
MSLFATFMWNWEDHPRGLRSSLINPWRIRLRTVEYNLLTQTIKVEAPIKKNVKRPRLLSFLETTDLMKKRYGLNLIIGTPTWKEAIPKKAGEKKGTSKEVGHFWDTEGKYWGTNREGDHCDCCWTVSRDFTNWEQRSRGAAGSAGNTYTGAGPSRGGRGGGGRGGGRGGAQVTNAFGTMSLGDTRAMPDSHSGQTYSYNKRFRSCNLIQGRAAKPDECCKPIVVTGEDGESLQTCPFCQRLRRLCTFTDGHTLWTNFESKENMWWRGLTLFEPLGQLWKDSLLIGKFKGVETVVYDGAAFDPDDEMEADANVWHASGRTMGGAKEEDEEELDVNKIAKFFDA